MDYWVLFALGAIGWGGFAVCAVVLKQKRRFNIQVLPMPDFIAPQFTGLPIIPEPIWNTRVEIEPEIPEEMHRLAELADPLIDKQEVVPQSGEWKRHQVYAAMLKNPAVKEIIGDEKWKASFAIELAVAQRRMSAEEVGT